MTTFEQMNVAQQAAAMTTICNIQMMQEKVTGDPSPFSEFEENTLDQLRIRQNIWIDRYNAYLKSQTTNG